MSFAAPIALAFFGLFLPVVLLYLLKQRRRRVEVSTLMFWEKILRDEQTVTSLTRLKKLLSLLLQLLFITLLALAVARPLFSGKLTGARRVVLFIDNSASMLVSEGSKTRFDLAQQKALGVVRGLGQGDSLMLVAVAGEPDVVHPFTDSKKDLQEAIQKLKPTHAETDFKQALKFVEQLPADERQTHVYLITDGAFEPLDFKPPAKTHFAYVPVGNETDNLGIASFQVRPLPFSARDFQIHIEVANHTTQEQKAPLELRINGRLADAFEFTIPAGKSVTRTLRQFSDTGGEIEAVLDAKDAFALDNHAYATLPRPSPIKVRLVTPGDVFLERVLATDDEVELQVVAPDKYVESDAAAVTVFSGWRPAKTPPGNSIFVGTWPDDLGLIRKGEVAKPLFTEWQRDHPINRHLALQNVSIEKAAGVESNAKFQKLASSFSDPLVLLSESDQQKVLVATFETATTDLPLRVAFPIMLANAIRYLSEAQTGERWQSPAIGSILTPGELAKYVSGPGTETTNALRTVVGPDETKISITTDGALVPVAKAGFYRGELNSGETVPLFAASLASPVESQIKPSKTLPLRSKEPLSDIKSGLRLGFEPWFLLALVGLILSAVEWVLFHRRVIE